MPARDEASLARAAAAGDGQAFAALYDEYEGRIFNFCLRLVGTREDAADATQDAFLKVLQRLPKLPDDRELNFGAYMFTAARNASYDVIGKRKRADPVDLIPETGARPLSGDERGDIHEDPERAAMLGAFQESVQTANAKLPERQREVLALREVEEMSYDEIAEILDMNRNSVAQLISRARIKLRDELHGTALESVALKSPKCERALPLIAMRQDGQLKSDEDRKWLEAHIADCDTCKVSIEAMSEAGNSYRAWAPVVPMVFLWKETAAKAAELTGSDWSDLRDRPRKLTTGYGGAAAGTFAPSVLGRSRGVARRVSSRVALGTMFVALFALLTLGAVALSDGDPGDIAPADAAATTSLPTDSATTSTVAERPRRKSKKVVVTRVHHTPDGRTFTTHETVVVPVTPPARHHASTTHTSSGHGSTGSHTSSGSSSPPPSRPPGTVSTPTATPSTPPVNTTPPPDTTPPPTVSIPTPTQTQPPPTTRPTGPKDPGQPGGGTDCGPNQPRCPG